MVGLLMEAESIPRWMCFGGRRGKLRTERYRLWDYTFSSLLSFSLQEPDLLPGSCFVSCQSGIWSMRSFSVIDRSAIGIVVTMSQCKFARKMQGICANEVGGYFV